MHSMYTVLTHALCTVYVWLSLIHYVQYTYGCLSCTMYSIRMVVSHALCTVYGCLLCTMCSICMVVSHALCTVYVWFSLMHHVQYTYVWLSLMHYVQYMYGSLSCTMYSIRMYGCLSCTMYSIRMVVSNDHGNGLVIAICDWMWELIPTYIPQDDANKPVITSMV